MTQVTTSDLMWLLVSKIWFNLLIVISKFVKLIEIESIIFNDNYYSLGHSF